MRLRIGRVEQLGAGDGAPRRRAGGLDQLGRAPCSRRSSGAGLPDRRGAGSSSRSTGWTRPAARLTASSAAGGSGAERPRALDGVRGEPPAASGEIVPARRGVEQDEGARVDHAQEARARRPGASTAGRRCARGAAGVALTMMRGGVFTTGTVAVCAVSARLMARFASSWSRAMVRTPRGHVLARDAKEVLIRARATRESSPAAP